MDRIFKTQVINGKFIISEQAVANWETTDRQTAWDRARAQANPVLFIDLEGNETELGDAFIPAVYERAMYQGHISYSLSMTDGHYAPEGFDRWVWHFRRGPLAKFNDARPEVLAATFRYADELAKIAA